MYGLGLLKGLTVTMKNMVLPSRMFTVHQYPDRKIGVWGLAKLAEKNALSYVFSEPMKAFKAMLGLITVEDRMPQHPRVRGEEFSFYLDRCTGCASCAKYCPLGIIRIVTHPSEEQMPEGDRYAIDVFDIDIGRCMFCGLCVEACPYDALHMGSGFEEGAYSRRDLVIDLDKLKTYLGSYAPPEKSVARRGDWQNALLSELRGPQIARVLDRLPLAPNRSMRTRRPRRDDSGRIHIFVEALTPPALHPQGSGLEGTGHVLYHQVLVRP